MGVIVCSVKDACKLMEHMNENDMIILTVIDEKRYLHDVPRRIRKKRGEELIEQAEDILYQNNDFFGVLSLYGIMKDNGVIHNLLFPKLE